VADAFLAGTGPRTLTSSMVGAQAAVLPFRTVCRTRASSSFVALFESVGRTPEDRADHTGRAESG
jgi:hypothetical protein